ncbi:MAG: hypothetical protein ACYCW6_02045 [Candidatus Xenobia bacterium]
MLEGSRFCDECGQENELPDAPGDMPIAPRGTGKLVKNVPAGSTSVRTVEPPVGEDVEQDVAALMGAAAGEMGISLDRHRYATGDTVRGELLLRLAQPTDASRLVVGLMALRPQAAAPLYRSELVLREKGSFDQGQFGFEIPLPGRAPAADVRWELFALLEVPGKLGVQRRIRLAVRPA